MKTCSKCKQQLALTEFYKNKTHKDGLQSYCKKCDKLFYYKEFICENCNSQFKINHRNVRQRKAFKCSVCRLKDAIKRNKAASKSFLVSTKGYQYLRDVQKERGYIFKHRRVVENHLGRKLTKDEVVHHIDGDRVNNDITNLFLTDNSGHSKAHHSLELLGYELLRKGMIVFDKESGIYKLVV